MAIASRISARKADTFGLSVRSQNRPKYMVTKALKVQPPTLVVLDLFSSLRHPLVMPDEPLTPATPDDLALSLSYALRYDERGKRWSRFGDQFAADMAARHLIKMLERSGYVIMKKAPPAAPSF
ncbi:MAG TPA: hypothetical protein VHB27_20525 [Rhodopila sp.]|uniref:hypothetical protein n=1 Tax=Rhodopila sp. TaxID=2480087 RepID=UPI002CF0FE24|nr:hypothetical protein [Rhodopila sp.]HVY17616.1 hypothetical protein [Rhodopila sp.]